MLERTRGNWWELSREPSGQAPDPATTPEAVVQVYAARTVGWRGLLVGVPVLLGHPPDDGQLGSGLILGVCPHLGVLRLATSRR